MSRHFAQAGPPQCPSSREKSQVAIECRFRTGKRSGVDRAAHGSGTLGSNPGAFVAEIGSTRSVLALDGAQR